MYEENNGIWTQIGLDIEGEDPDYSIAGIAFSSEGSRVAVSEVEYYTGLGARIKIYEENNGIWTQLGMDIEGEVPYDWFGFAFSLSGDGTMVAIGDPGTFFESTERGYVRIYEENNGTWTQMGMDMEGENIGDYFGYSVSLSSDKTTVAVGTAVFNSDGEAAGHVRIFDLSLNPSAISDRKFNSDITLNVLPNPSLETFFIELSKDVKTLIVTDLNGKIIKSIPVLGATNHTINLIGVDSGIYLLRAISKHSTKVQQLIKL